MRKTTHHCDQCDKNLTGSYIGHFEVNFVDNILSFPPLDFCGMECMIVYLNKRKDEMNERNTED